MQLPLIVLLSETPAHSEWLESLVLSLQRQARIERKGPTEEIRPVNPAALVVKGADLERDPFETLLAIHSFLESGRDWKPVIADPFDLEAGAGALREAEEAERRRLAKELHSTTGQSLVTLQFALNSALRETVGKQLRDLLEESSRTVDEVIEQIRKVSHELRSSILDDLGLLPAIRALCRRTGATFQCTTPPPRLPEVIETACYRVAQASLGGSAGSTLVLNAIGGTVQLSIFFAQPEVLNERNLLAMKMHAFIAQGRLQGLSSARLGRTELHALFPVSLACRKPKAR